MKWTRPRSVMAMTGSILLLVFFHNMPMSSIEQLTDKSKGSEVSLLQSNEFRGVVIKEDNEVSYLQSKTLAAAIKIARNDAKK